MKTLRVYQNELVAEVMSLVEKHPEVCLTSCTGSGKTMMASEICTRYLRAHPKARIWISGHGTTVIRDQIFQEFQDLKPPFTFALVKAGEKIGKEQVIISIPQTMYSRKALPSFDFAIFDEGHEFSDASMAADVLRRSGVTRRLDLTATPSPFIRRQVPVVAFSLLDGLRLGVIADPLVELGVSDYMLTDDDYTESGEVTDSAADAKMTEQATAATMSRVHDKLLEMITRRLRNGSSVIAKFAGGRLPGDLEFVYGELEKSMIVTRSIAQAAFVCRFLSARGVRALVSDYDTDRDSVKIDQFKSDPQVSVLVVVNRGTLGFNFPELGALVDLSETKNPNRILQMIGRIVRKDEKRSQDKLFLKVAASALKEDQEHRVGFTMMLAHRETLLSWDGSDLLRRPIPSFRDDDDDSRSPEAGERRESENPKKRNVRPATGLRFSEFFDKVVRDKNGVLDIYASTTLALVRERYHGIRAKNQRQERLSQFAIENCRVPSSKIEEEKGLLKDFVTLTEPDSDGFVKGYKEVYKSLCRRAIGIKASKRSEAGSTA